MGAEAALQSSQFISSEEGGVDQLLIHPDTGSKFTQYVGKWVYKKQELMEDSLLESFFCSSAIMQLNVI